MEDSTSSGCCDTAAILSRACCVVSGLAAMPLLVRVGLLVLCLMVVSHAAPSEQGYAAQPLDGKQQQEPSRPHFFHRWLAEANLTMDDLPPEAQVRALSMEERGVFQPIKAHHEPYLNVSTNISIHVDLTHASARDSLLLPSAAAVRRCPCRPALKVEPHTDL